MNHALGGDCNSAFGVRFHNRTQVLTAAHCTSGTGLPMWNGADEPMGVVSVY
jgi:hypothetical protein